MNVALDTNAYRDFMRGDPARVQVVLRSRPPDYKAAGLSGEGLQEER